jgi:toxin HigB-1
MAIKTFKHKGLKKFFEIGAKSKINTAHIKKLELILDLLDSANDIQDMNFPGSNFHPLKGKLKNFYSIHVSGNWAVIFQFKGNDAYDVDYLDYH